MKFTSFIVCYFLFTSILFSQIGKTEHRIESKLLFAVIDNNTISKELDIKQVQKFKFDSFSVYNSYTSEYLKADSILLMYITPFDVKRETFYGGEIGLLKGLKDNIKSIKKGDIIYISAYIHLSGVRYRIYFTFLTQKKEDKLSLVPSKISYLEKME